MKYCVYCGKALQDTARFCDGCGRPSQGASVNQPQQPAQNLYHQFTDHVNKITGGQGGNHPPLRELVSQIFVKHTRQEAEDIFICGTASTTPHLSLSNAIWPHPWLFSRILMAFAAAFLMLHVCCYSFGNSNSYPGMIVIGSFAVPIAVFVFFLEMNTPKNISFFTAMKIFLVGGCASLLFTLLLYDLVEVGDGYLGAVLISIVEELGKLGIVAFFIRQEKLRRYNVNGLLVGAAVGAGFAAFESAGYAFNVLLATGSYNQMFENILLRALLSPGGHVVWAAMSGYAVMMVSGGQEVSADFLGKAEFWKIFLIPVMLHAIWDMPIPIGQSICLVQILCTLTAWVVILIIINNCLSQIGTILIRQSHPIP